MPKECGCGRSSTEFCQGLHSLSEEQWKEKKDSGSNE
tara:strand:+ start:941 stop:1051 length:111 start_codon:yes stop_codon:yes gene_type:complete